METNTPFAGTPAPSLLHQARRDVKLKQIQVATELGYETPQFVSNWERGVSLPPPHAVNTLARLYELDRAQLAEVLRVSYTQAFARKAKELYG